MERGETLEEAGEPSQCAASERISFKMQQKEGKTMAFNRL